MGEVLRRLLYPLVLPAIVLTVWGYARVMQHGARGLPEPAQAVTDWASPQTLAAGESDDRPAPGYGFRAESNFFATAADDDAP